MLRAARLLLCACLPTLLFASTLPTSPVFKSLSTGLIAFSGEDQSIRAAVVLAEPDEAIVETVVNFIDAQGTVLKKQHAELREGHPVIAELTRRDVGERGNLLVRVQVIHKLSVRDRLYPILVTVQPITPAGVGRFTLDLGGGDDCGCIGTACGTGEHEPGTTAGVHAMCLLDVPAAY